MKPENVVITPPEGYEIDRENSTFECIKFKPKQFTYDDLAEKLFANKTAYYADMRGRIVATVLTARGDCSDATNCTTSKQVEKLLALNKLINVAKYLNDGWEPNFSNCSEKYFLYTHGVTRTEVEICVTGKQNTNWCSPCFKSADLAKQAIEILGEETVKLALSQV